MTKQEDQLSSSLEPQHKPKLPMEVNFTTWAEKYAQFEKNQFENEDEKESRLFWIKTTNDFTKLSQTQHYFQYLSFAKLRPKLHFLIRSRFFEKWRKGVYVSRWSRLARGLRKNQLLEEMREVAEKIKYVRTQIAIKAYSTDIDERKTKESINKITDNLVNQSLALNNLSPRPTIPYKPPSPRANQSKLGSPKRSTKSKSRKSGLKSPKTRDIDLTEEPKEELIEEQEIKEAIPAQEVIEEEEIKEEIPAPETCETESQTVHNEPTKRNFLVYLIPIISLLLGVVMFYVVSPPYAFNSLHQANNDVYQPKQEPVHATQAEILNDNITKTTANASKKDNSDEVNQTQITDDKNNSTVLENNHTTSNEQTTIQHEKQLDQEKQNEEKIHEKQK